MNRSDFSEMNRNRMRKMLLTQTDADRPNSVLNTIVRNMLKEFEQRPVTRSSIRKSASSSNIPPVTSAVSSAYRFVQRKNFCGSPQNETNLLETKITFCHVPQKLNYRILFFFMGLKLSYLGPEFGTSYYILWYSSI